MFPPLVINETINETANETVNVEQNTTIENNNIGDYIFLEGAEYNGNEEYIGKRITKYEFNNTLYKVIEYIFENSTAVRAYWYAHYPVRTDEVAYINISNKQVLFYDEKYIWFRENEVITLSPAEDSELLHEYLKHGSLVAKNTTDTGQVFKKLEFIPARATPQEIKGEIIDIKSADFSVKEISIQNESGNFTILASCSDYSNTAGSCSTKGQWGWIEPSYDVYRCNDMIFIGQLLCWELESEEGDWDYCSVLYDKIGFQCVRHEADCDENYECANYLSCVDGDGFARDGCCFDSENYDGSWCYSTCSTGWLSEYRCSGHTRQRKYQNQDCSTQWKTYEQCNDDSTGPWGSLYCSGNNEDITKQRTVYNEYCSSSSDSCRTSTSPEYQTVSQEGDSDYCDKALTAGCACTEGEGDCDVFGGDECASGYYCDVAWLGGTDYCCPTGSSWDGSSCEPDDNCQITSVSWDKTSATEDDSVGITTYGNQCSGKTVNFEVWENDCFGLLEANETYNEQGLCNQPVNTQPNSVTFSGSTATSSWTAEFQGDINGDPEYYVHALYNSQDVRSSNKLTIACKDNDNDGYCDDVDCNDNDNTVSPGATEICNTKDDNCDGTVNEGFNLDTDPNNCGACGSVCAGTCSNGNCIIDNCGDNTCQNDESETTCPQDCYGDIRVLFINTISPSSAQEGDTVTFNAVVENQGTITETTFIEGAVVPESWAGIAYPQEVSNNPFPVCPGNDFYDAKIVEVAAENTETVTFTVTAPTKDTLDACNGLGSAWDTSFRIIAGTYEDVQGGPYQSFQSVPYAVDTPLPCEHPYGTSSECSCPNYSCNGGYVCDTSNFAYGTCVEEETCNIPDGSSSSCDCDKDKDCPSQYSCALGSGWDACIQDTIPDECTTIDEYACKEGNVHRCENVDGRKTLVLTDVCTYNELCPADVDSVKQCVSVLSYDIRIEHASSGVVVYKQPGDSVYVTVDADQSLSYTLQYDAIGFTLKTLSCGLGSFQKGKTLCEFEAKETGRYIFTLGDDVEVVEVIDEPYALYITHVPNLYKRYNDDPSVEVLLTKTYEKAGQNKGIVYDLNKEISTDHPFSSYHYYRPTERNNAFTLAAGRFTQSRCNGCREIIIIGDDFIVPSYQRIIREYESKFLFWNNLIDHFIFTDIPFVNREKLLFSDFDEVFKTKGKFEGKNVLFILPDQNVDTQPLENAFETRGYKPDVDQVQGSTINCIDNSWLQDAKGKTLIIIGTESSNDALKCYPFIANQGEDTAFMEKNLWDADEYAIIINTDDPKVLEAFTEIIDSGAYVKLRSETAYFFSVGTQIVGYAAMGVGIVVMTVGTGGAAPIALIAAGAILEGVADSSDVVDTCGVNFESVGWCSGTIGMAAIPLLPSKPVKGILRKLGDNSVVSSIINRLDPFKNVIERNFKKLKNEVFGKELWRRIIRKNGDNVHLARGIKRLFGDNLDVADIPRRIKTSNGLPVDIRKLQEATYIKSVGKVDEGVSLIGNANKKAAFEKKFNDLLKDVDGPNFGNSKGARGEIESLGFENLDDLEDINYKFTKQERELIGGGGEIDILRSDGTIVETKFLKDWNSLDEAIEKQTKKLADFQKLPGKQEGEIIFRQKVDVLIDTQDQLDSIVPKQTIDKINAQRVNLNKVDIQLEIIDSQGNLWRIG